MDMNELTPLITSVGFPIVMCIVLLKYMRDMQTENKETYNNMSANHKAEIDSLKESLNNNTQVLVKLETMLSMLSSKLSGKSGED